MNNAIEIALRTWYPKDHPLHFELHHPLGKLVSEWGELLNDYMNNLYKPDFVWKPVNELIDVWYYLRILSYQTNITFNTMHLKGNVDLLISGAIEVTSSSFTLLCDKIDISSILAYLISHSYSVMSSVCELTNVTIDQLTEASWQKLKPGSIRGEEWTRV